MEHTKREGVKMTNWLTKLAYRIWDWIMGIDRVVMDRLEYYCRVEDDPS